MKKEIIIGIALTALVVIAAISCMVLSTSCGADVGAQPASPAPTSEVWVDCPGEKDDREICSECSLGPWWIEGKVMLFKTIRKDGSIVPDGDPASCVPKQR